ncbi:HEPN domain-containing protein [Neorhizobium sp. NPDC001467]|uniref:HEPN domain-containing protein n=1 Tax=Neorhizobium sp. NPDC001467 TaxID=3390595 RepID=UPI003D035E5C
MPFGLRGDVLKALSASRIEEARILFERSHYSGAFYLAGYAVEFSLKACLAKMIEANAIPSKAFINDIHTHDYLRLVGSAGLRGALKQEQEANPAFHANWAIAAQWSPEARYESTDRSSAQLLLLAISDPEHGVYRWTKSFW